MKNNSGSMRAKEDFKHLKVMPKVLFNGLKQY